MHWMIDYELLKKIERPEMLFHKVLPFFHHQNVTFVFALTEELTDQQQDFVRSVFPKSSFLTVQVPSLDAIGDIYDEYRNTFGAIGLTNFIFFEAIQMGISDIHFEHLADCGRIRFRLDGELLTFRELSLDEWGKLMNRVKVLGGLRLDEAKYPQIGRQSLFLGNKEIDLRFSSHPTIFGESVVVRILDKQLKPLEISELGFSDDICEKLRALLKMPYGLIIFTGPTGSGKTTTLFSLLNEINAPYTNIMTLEDPVEYVLEGAKQTEIKPGTVEEFNEGLRSILRQDPDVILIGEMRDEETAQMALRAAMTGHKVFSTLHANTAFQVLQRLIDLGVSPSLISGNLKGIISQRLVRKVCNFCEGEGCAKCYKSGFRGRVPVAEVLRIDGVLDEMIAMGTSIARMEKHAESTGFFPLKKYALELVEKDVLTLQEVEKVVL